MRTLTAALTALLCLSTPCFADDEFAALSGDEITAAISGQTMEGFYAQKRVETGNQDYSETYNPDGTLTYSEKGVDDTGQWTVTRNILCHTYDSDPRTYQHCFMVFQKENCYYYYDHLPRTARGLDEDWNNRSIVRGVSKTCEQLIS